MMKTQDLIQVIMTDGTTELATDVMDTLIASEVKNTIKEVDSEYDLTKPKDINTLSEMIAYHLEINTHVYVHPKRVIKEFKEQLKSS